MELFNLSIRSYVVISAFCVYKYICLTLFSFLKKTILLMKA